MKTKNTIETDDRENENGELRERIKFVSLDALPIGIADAILDNESLGDGYFPEHVLGLIPSRWVQVAEIFDGQRGCDVLVCLGAGMKIKGVATYLRISERQAKNIAESFITRTEIMYESGQRLKENSQLEGFWEGLRLPAPRVRSKRGRPRKGVPGVPQPKPDMGGEGGRRGGV